MSLGLNTTVRNPATVYDRWVCVFLGSLVEFILDQPVRHAEPVVKAVVRGEVRLRVAQVPSYKRRKDRYEIRSRRVIPRGRPRIFLLENNAKEERECVYARAFSSRFSECAHTICPTWLSGSPQPSVR
jgi:hypothetical protein